MSDESAANARERQVNRVVAEYLEAQRLGQAPDREELLRQHPEIADDLRSFLADQAHFGQVAQGIGPPAAVHEVPTMDQGKSAATGAAIATVQYFGDYELLEEIARGGMGVVYRARQVSLNRTVALKMR
jgi:serine/threonine-protein kinase